MNQNVITSTLFTPMLHEVAAGDLYPGERKVEIFKGTRVTGYDGALVQLNNGTSIPAATLIWTAGVTPCSVIASLPFQKRRGRLLVNEFLNVLDRLFGREIEQLVTLRDVETLSDLLSRS